MAQHPVSCSRSRRYLHSGRSNRIDSAEGVQLFFPLRTPLRKCYSIINVLQLMAVLSPPAPMTRSVHCRTVCHLPALGAAAITVHETQYAGVSAPRCVKRRLGLMWLCPLTLIVIDLCAASQICGNWYEWYNL